MEEEEEKKKKKKKEEKKKEEEEEKKKKKVKKKKKQYDRTNTSTETIPLSQRRGAACPPPVWDSTHCLFRQHGEITRAV